MTLHAADLGATANNFLGKSQFADPYFAGSSTTSASIAGR